MAVVAFVSLYDRNAYGLRLMSANLKKHGHRCHIIFLKRYDTRPSYRLDLEVGEYPWQGMSKSGRVFKYASNSRITVTELELLKGLIEELRPDVIGMTVNTPLRAQSVRVTRFLKQCTAAPIIWGGYDPTVNPLDCVKLCDFCCIGEGDQTILDIADRIDGGLPFGDVSNLAYLRDGRNVVMPKHQLEHDLDRYPWRDNAPEDKYLIEDNRLKRDHPALNDKSAGSYQAMSARGCPYRCSYCCEATFKELYSGEQFLRRRSPQDLVAELVEMKQRHGIEQVYFEDEIFAMNMAWLKVFAPLYREQVNLPFLCYIYPTRQIEPILTLLKGAGLFYCCLALESGSERINKKVFQRVYDRELFLRTVDVCNQLGLRFYTDVITYNPYEEEEDLRKTLDVLLQVKGSYDMCINKLFVLPGTQMAEQMKIDGVTLESHEKDRLFNYYSRLFWLTGVTRRAIPIVQAIQRVGWFRRHPGAINPALFEVVFKPASAARALATRCVPPTARAALAGRRAKFRARRRASVATPAVTPTVCR